MGELFLGWDSQLDRKLAIKLVHARSSSAAAEERLRQEAKALAQLSHPNVVQVFEVGSHAGRVYVAMEFVEGKSLRDWLVALDLQGASRVAAIVDRFVAAGRGLEAVHGSGLIHRDFKPSNVVVGDEGRVRIIDFGLAGELDEQPDVTPAPTTDAAVRVEPERWDATLTDTGVLLGTPRYMAPEQWRGRPGDLRSDQFAWCVALFEALYGVHPYEHAGVEGLAKRTSSTLRRLGQKIGLAEAMAGGEIELPTGWGEVPVHVREALVRGLSLDPQHRFGGMGELLDHVAPPVTSGRWKLLAGIGVVLVLALMLVLLIVPERDGPILPSASARARVEALAARDLVRVEQRVAELTEQEQIAEADATFAAYAELPDYATTAALGRGWLNHGRRLASRGDVDGELDAYGAAYLSASPDTQRDALLRLARVFARTRQWSRLRATVDTLDALGTLDASPLDPAASQELCGMRVIELASRRELAEAALVLGRASSDSACSIHPSLGAAIGELAKMTPTEHEFDGFELRVGPMPGLDLDDDGVGELPVYRPDESKLTVLGSASPSLAALGTIELSEPPDGLSMVPGASEPILALRHHTQVSLHRVDASADGTLGLTKLFEFNQGNGWPIRWTSGDLDDDGQIESYLSVTATRRLLAAWPGESSWVSADPHPATAAVNSVPYDLTIGDFDGDGRRELAVAIGEWSAYDLRILGPAPAPEGDADADAAGPMLELLGRRKLGTVLSLAKIPAPTGKGTWLAVGVSDRYPSRRVFPNPPANGVPGVYVLAWDGKTLEQIAFVDATPPDLMFAGDFNADGLGDLALGSAPLAEFETTVLIQTSPGVFVPMTLVDMWPIGVLDRDRDGDDELLVLDTSQSPNARDLRPRGRLFVLGSGTGRLPSLADAESTSGQPSDAHVEDEAFRAAIARAEDLATIGLPLSAAAALRKLARVAEPELAAHLWLRAAELLEASGHRLEAAELYAQASADPAPLGERASATRREAMQLYEQVHRFRAAADMAASALELAGDDAALASEHARLEALASEAPRLVFDFDESLDAGWTIDPLAVRRRSGRLELSLGGTEQDVIARRELQWDGGRLSLEVDLEVELIEWSSAIEVSLRPVAGPPEHNLRVGAKTVGGGGLYNLMLECVAENVPEPGAQGYPIAQPQAELPEDRRKFRLRAELVPTRRTWCTAQGPGVHVEVGLPDPKLVPGRYELVIRGSNMERWGRAAASIDRIVVIGARELSEAERTPESPAASLARDLAEGRMEAVLEGLDASAALEPRERALLKFLALDELGRPEQREQALIAALGSCGDDATSRVLVGRLLRHRPEHLGPDLYRLCGADKYFSILTEVWGSAFYQHPDSTTAGRVLTTLTAGLERWQPENPADRHKVLTLFCARARARASLGTPGPNRADLERAVELGDRWLAEDGVVGHADLATQLGRCRVDLAAERLDRGEADGAIENLRETLERSPTPEILADMLTIDPRFGSLRERAAWRDLIEPARAGTRAKPGAATQPR
jgi:predicted Ser/Thr protein kinase